MHCSVRESVEAFEVRCFHSSNIACSLGRRAWAKPPAALPSSTIPGIAVPCVVETELNIYRVNGRGDAEVANTRPHALRAVVE